MDERLYDALDQALAELEAGTDFELVVSAHPEIRSELETARMLKSSGQTKIPSGAANRSRTQILARAARLRKDTLPRKTLFGRVPRFAVTFIFIAIVLLSGGGLIAASAQAIPGDELYPVKRSFETVRLGLTINPQSHQQIEEQYQSRRLDEVERLLALKRQAMVQFVGIVDQQGAGFWMVSGIKVDLTPETIVLGEILPGMNIEVEGATEPEGWVQALEIHLQTFDFIGYVESISADVWEIDGRKVNITPRSLIDLEIQVGDWVIVSVQSDDFGVLTVQSIKLYEQATPTISIPSSTPTKTQNPSPTSDEGQGEIEDESSHNVEGDDRRVDSTGTLEVEDTHEPDATAEVDETDEPEKTEKPDKTDEHDDHDEHDE